jgi:hypothetical protein
MSRVGRGAEVTRQKRREGSAPRSMVLAVRKVDRRRTYTPDGLAFVTARPRLIRASGSKSDLAPRSANALPRNSPCRPPPEDTHFIENPWRTETGVACNQPPFFHNGWLGRCNDTHGGSPGQGSSSAESPEHEDWMGFNGDRQPNGPDEFTGSLTWPRRPRKRD